MTPHRDWVPAHEARDVRDPGAPRNFEVDIDSDGTICAVRIADPVEWAELQETEWLRQVAAAVNDELESRIECDGKGA